MVVVEEEYSSSATAPAPATEAFDGEGGGGGGWWAQFNLIERRLCVSLRTDLGDSSGSSYY